MGAPKIVKRYANRKLYDTERSCYVTLDDIATMIKVGDEVQVIDNKSGEDLTSVTLAQIIFEAEKKNNFMPMGLLRELIQNKGEALGSFYKERVDKVQATAVGIKDTAQARAQDIRNKADKLRGDITHRLGDVLRKGEDAVEEFAAVKNLMASSQEALDELHQNVEDRVKGGVGVLGRELKNLRKRLADLEAKLGRSD